MAQVNFVVYILFHITWNIGSWFHILALFFNSALRNLCFVSLGNKSSHSFQDMPARCPSHLALAFVTFCVGFFSLLVAGWAVFDSMHHWMRHFILFSKYCLASVHSCSGVVDGFALTGQSCGMQCTMDWASLPLGCPHMAKNVYTCIIVERIHINQVSEL